MADPWKADVDVTEELAATLIETQFPELAPVHVSTLGIGWDNAAFLINDSTVFRLPRRRMGAELIDRECRSLPHIASHLTIPIPRPQYIGVPADSYPYPFAGYPVIAGTTSCRLPLTDADRIRNAVPIAAFLRALHSIPIDHDTRILAPTDDDIRRADIARRVPLAIERLHAIGRAFADVDSARLIQIITALGETPPYSGTSCWVHGDLYARHLLMDDRHDLCGVIDWGDVHLGDPALDLSIAFSFLPALARTQFRDTYGDIDHATWDRARFRAIHYGSTLVTYGASVGDRKIHAVGEYALANAGA